MNNIYIEFLGMPASGKSTVIDYLKTNLPILKDATISSTEDVASALNITPFQFNLNIIKYTNSILKNPNNKIIIFDRGTTDYNVWLDAHRTLKNISEEEFFYLRKRMPNLPAKSKNVKILFMNDVETSLLRCSMKSRRPHRPGVDDWGLNKNALNVLFELYSNLSKENSNFCYTINTIANIEDVQNRVKHLIVKVISSLY